MRSVVTTAALLLALAACGDDTGAEASAGPAPDADTAEVPLDAGAAGPPADTGSDTTTDDAGPSTRPFVELEEALRIHEGEAVVASQSTENGVTTYEFARESGPICLRGAPFRLSVRDGTAAHDDLVIFLQGGGACWTDLCIANEKAGRRIPEQMDILNPTKPSNPVRDWDLVYVPYCDGSFFAGDADLDDDGDGTIDRYQRGLRNLTAALDIARERYPVPERIVLAGSSGGGLGTIMATPLVRMLYPDAEIYVFNDAGVGVADAAKTEFFREQIDELNARRFIPPSCADCFESAHLTHLVEWELERDPSLRVSVFSSYHDFVIATIYLRMAPQAFEEALRAETGRLHERFPDRYMPFLVEGTMHTTLLGDNFGLPEFLDDVVDFGGIDTTQVDGLTIAAWFRMMLDGDPGWAPVIE